MKVLLTICMVLLLNVGIHAQNDVSKVYLLLEFMQVKGEQSSEYLKVEDFWSGIHKQRLADKSILGWDLWSLTPAGKEQGSQYLTVTLFPSLQGMLQAINSLDVVAYAKKAYPNKPEKELTGWMERTAKSRDVAHQDLFRLIDKTNDDFKMKPGTIFTIDIMKQLDDNYEKVESEIFKPLHQQMVNEGKKGSWKLLQTILPSGSEAYGTHLTVSMYQDEAQLASFMESTGGEMDYKTLLAVKQGIKTRDLRETKFGKLLITVH